MPQAVTHILVPILLVALFRDIYLKKKERSHFPLHYVLIAGLGGVLPDIDIVISLILKLLGSGDWWIHKTFTHSLFFPLSLFILFILLKPVHTKAKICNIGRHNLKLSLILLMLSIGSLIHIILDMLIGGEAFLFYPFYDHDFGLNLISLTGLDWNLATAILDGALLVIWIVYLELKHKISDFI